jgi:hypothetical protein
MPFTLPHVGIVLTVIGTIFLALSVKVESSYEGDIAKVLDKAKKENPNLTEPTETSIDRLLFWVGLFFIAIGALCQW